MRNYYGFSQLLHANGLNFAVKRTITNHKHIPSRVLLLLLMLFWVHCRIAVLNDLFALRQFSAYRKSHCIQRRKSDCIEPVSICVQCSNIAVAWWGSSNGYTGYTFVCGNFTVNDAIYSSCTRAHDDGRQCCCRKRNAKYTTAHISTTSAFYNTAKRSRRCCVRICVPRCLCVYSIVQHFPRWCVEPLRVWRCVFGQKTKRSVFKCQFIVYRRLEMMFNIFVIIWKSINTFVILLPYFGVTEYFGVF